MTIIGIKSSIDPAQLTEKLNVQPFPALIELHLTRHDTNAEVRGTIERLRRSHPQLQFMLHSPVTPLGKIALAIDSPDYAALLRFAKLCASHPHIIGGVMHTQTVGMPFLGMRVARNLEALREAVPELDSLWYFENLPGETGKEKGFREFQARFAIKQITLNMSHWLAENSLASLEAYLMERTEMELPTYVHISDHTELNNNPSSEHIGKGSVAWETMTPLIDFGIIETESEPEQLGREMKLDYRKFMDFKTGVRQRSLF